MYVHTSFRNAKTDKIGKKRVCFFGHIDRFWKGYDGQIKNAHKNTYLRSIFIPVKHVSEILTILSMPLTGI